MRKLFFILLTIVIFNSAEAGIKTSPPRPIRTALVIGNSLYRTAPLKNPENDAIDMAKLLADSGFNVVTKINVTKRQMEKAIQQFGRALLKGGTGLFYYAGHGMQVDGRNYLIPVDALIETESDVLYEAVDAGRVLGKMEDASNDLNIVILDACRNNPYVRSFRSSTPGLARMDAPKGSFISYSTAPGSVAADGEGRNGIFTKHLIKNIQIPNLKIEEVFKRVRIAVLKETQDKQIPWESSSLVGNFVFNYKGNGENTPSSDIETDGQDLASRGEKDKANRVSLLSGWWDAWQEKQAQSELIQNNQGEKIWNYSIPPGDEDINAGLNIFVDPVSLKNRQIYIKLHSKKGNPIYLRLYSFIPEYSKKDNDESYLPAEKLLYITSGLNEIRIDPKNLEVPEWWMEEHNNPDIDFNWDDIRILEFSAEIRDKQNSVSDEINVQRVEFFEN